MGCGRALSEILKKVTKRNKCITLSRTKGYTPGLSATTKILCPRDSVFVQKEAENAFTVRSRLRSACSDGACSDDSGRRFAGFHMYVWRIPTQTCSVHTKRSTTHCAMQTPPRFCAFSMITSRGHTQTAECKVSPT